MRSQCLRQAYGSSSPMVVDTECWLGAVLQAVTNFISITSQTRRGWTKRRS